ncbi:MAG: CBS domain-containing protein [Nanoarchaeota archaeon]|nr:CBS domain-containing protein [Nanoarchaeota archaeon]
MVWVKDIMSTHVIFAEIDTNIQDVIQTMIRNNIGSIIIMDKGIPKGILTERDIVRNFMKADGDQPVSTIMSTPVITIGEDEPVINAATKLVDNNIKKLIVIDGTDITGVITQTDLVSKMREWLPKE